MVLGGPNPMLPNVVVNIEEMPTTTLAVIHRTGNEVVAASVDARSLCGEWRSSSDYAVRGERGEPRGRKFGGGSGADSPTWPARAEGEKRFRSATRNP